MQLGQAQVVRSNWYDRSILTQSYLKYVQTSPHASTVRATYTVPANRVGLIDIASLQIQRLGVASAVGNAYSMYQITKSGAGAELSFSLFMKGNTLFDYVVGARIGKMYLEAGDKIEFVTVNGDTGGSLNYAGGWSLIEYNA